MTITQKRHVALIATCCAMLVLALSAALLPAALLRVSDDLNVNTGTLVRVVATQFAAFFLSTLISGFLSDRYGKHPILQLGCVLITVGASIWAVADHLLVAHLAAMVMGMGAGILEGVGSALLADLYPEKRKFVLNITQVAYCGGAAMGPALMSWLLPLGISWRLFFVGESVLGVLLLALYGATPAPPAPLSTFAKFGDLIYPLRLRSVRALALSLFCYVSAEACLAVATTAYLQNHHQAPEQWAILGTSLLWLTMLVGRMICAVLPEGLSTERLVAGLSVAGAISLVAQWVAPDWRVSFVLFGVSGLIFSGIWPLIVALCATRHPLRSGSTVGVVVASGALGVVAAPLVVGRFIENDNLRVLLYPLFAVVLLGTAVLVLWPVKSPTTLPPSR